MKHIIMFGSLTLAILYSTVPNLAKPKPLWWRVSAVIFVTAALVLAIYPPVSGGIGTTQFLKDGSYKELNVNIEVKKDQVVYDNAGQYWLKALGNADISQASNLRYDQKLIIKYKELPYEFKSENNLVVRVKYNKDLDALEFIDTRFINPPFTYPFAPSLDERIRIINLHVPLAWIAVIAYFISMMYSIRYLRTNDLKFDIYNESAASLGNLFAILATVTGMLWAKFNWGNYWNWDPRQTSIFILIMIYAAFFVLRSAIDNEQRRAKLSSVYSIISFVTVPFLIFVLPRLASGLHPGAKGDVNAGPLVSVQQDSLNSNLSWSFGLSLFAFTILFFWLLNLLIRTNKLRQKKLEV